MIFPASFKVLIQLSDKQTIMREIAKIEIFSHDKMQLKL